MTDKQKISELKELIESLCACVRSQPAGCEGCWYFEEEEMCEIKKTLSDLEGKE